MSSTLKLIQDIEAIYEKPIIELKNKSFICPVCGKSYMKQHSAELHLARKSCHKLKDIVTGTLTEARAYEIYKDVLSNVNPRARISMNGFKKSPMYNSFVRFVMFCTLHEVFDPLCYLDWLNQIKNLQNLPLLLKVGIEEATVREFRTFAQVMELMNSQKFFDAYKEDLLTDDGFLVRSLEKAKISIKWLARSEEFPFAERMENLPIDYQNRIEEIAKELV